MGAIKISFSLAVVVVSSRRIEVESCVVALVEDELGVSLAIPHKVDGRDSKGNLQVLLHEDQSIVVVGEKHLSSLVSSELESKLGLSLVLEPYGLKHVHGTVTGFVVDAKILDFPSGLVVVFDRHSSNAGVDDRRLESELIDDLVVSLVTNLAD